ncbi:hypothetical protein [Polyangium sp. 15x6]|uniref:hypothetical protein n=1 Tax=Polyangium sp. 15x6 TaxID=3042687 RepID=UPI00249AF19D|nr:hypothetical protein [Polyangium sp. 15x6]MDI3288341.1 hypothetical protein [Polyangium sp. 15x6]
MPPRVYGLRLYALDWLRALTPLEPRLRGPLAEDELEPDRFADCIEIDVAGDELALVDLLDRLGHRAHRLTGAMAPVFVVEAFETVEITVRPGDTPPDDEPTCNAAELASRMRSWLPKYAYLIDGAAPTCRTDLTG